MNIGRQWEDRLRIWAEQFSKHYYRPWGDLQVSYFTTVEHLAFDDAVKGPFRMAAPGEKWGKKWEYGWFRTELTVPAEAEGKRIVFTLGAGSEMLVWVNGVESGAIDKRHTFITLSRCAKAGERYEIYAECYAGHGVRNEGAGIVAVGQEPVPEPPEKQVTIAASHWGTWNEELFQVAMDYLALYALAKKLPEKSLRLMKVVEGLKKFTYIADFELPEPELTDSVVEAGKVLKPLLECKNGSTAPEFTVFGQSHLDLAWLWTADETLRKSARTYSNQLALMEEYEDFKFLLCEPPILEYLKEYYPNVWQRVQEKVSSGNFLPEGAMWVESDTNIPSGESLIRQMVWGKRWFRRELGVDSKLAWMPDTFGFSAALPQILKKCQIPYFATQKLTRQDPECDPFPYNVFWWEGMDGTKVLSHLFKKSNARLDPGDLITRWEEDRIQQENIDGMIYPFGFGDGGGGPTREMVEMAKRCADLEGAPRCRMENPAKYFERQEDVQNTYTGELYLAWHRGTLTSQAATKALIRRAEVALKQTEYLLSRQLLSGKEMPENWRQRLEELWKTLLFNQFHDVATGASIKRVHEVATEELLEVIHGCWKLITGIAGDDDDHLDILFNHLSWPVKVGNVTIPAQSCATIENAKVEREATVVHIDGKWVLENSHLRCVINETGELVSVQKPGSHREYLAGIGNRFLMYKDVNTCYDSWEHASMYENVPVMLDNVAQIRALPYEGAAALMVQRKIHNSEMTQLIVLGHDDRLDFSTRIEWQERHKLLKVAFPVNVHATEAIHEVQFGYVKRPTHRSRQHDKDLYEVCNHRYTALCDGAHGAAVLNDSKYGVSTHGNEIRLTLLKSALMPDQYADQGNQHIIYSFYPFEGTFEHSDVVRKAIEMNEPPVMGSIGDDLGPVFLPDAQNIIVETIKPADTVENALLVRAYEAMGMQTDCAFAAHPNIKKITETDMLEENPAAVDISRVHFGAFEIKTFILTL